MDTNHSLSLHELAPNTNIQKGCTYFKALDFALANDSITNIAISGGYGSGKSSILKTYFSKNTEYEKCEISLADFEFDDAQTKKNNGAHCVSHGFTNVQLNNIEKSILQQIIYQCSPEKIPLSRFRRIIQPNKSVLLKTGSWCVFFLLTALILVNQNKFWDDLSLSRPTTFLWFAVAAACFSSFVYILVLLYKRFPNLNVKKISIANGEIETDENVAGSVLNAYLEEILYYFEKSEVDVVIIEDLDRFDNYEIFSKLRELNRLINGYINVTKKVRFIYAVKDSILSGVNKSKFFDFVIPVIPIVDFSNSKDKLIERHNESRFDLTEELLIGISIYISDLRVIHNIFNEFEIYADALGYSGNCDDLFSYIVYKNVNPKDFSRFHHWEGALYQVLNSLEQLRAEKEKTSKAKKDSLANKLEEADKTLFNEQGQLISMIMGEVFRSSQPSGLLTHIRTDVGITLLSDCYRSDFVEELLSSKRNSFGTETQSYSAIHVDQLKTTQLLGGDTYEEYTKKIEAKSEFEKSQTKRKLYELESSLSKISIMELADLISEDYVKQICDEVEVTDYKLLTYLLINGFINEHNSQVISVFHEGAITQKDREYFKNVLNKRHSDLSYQLDNPKNVIRQLAEDHFKKPFVLNFQLVNQLLEGDELHQEKRTLILKTLSENPEECKNFLLRFPKHTSNSMKLYSALVNDAGFASGFFDLSYASELLAILIENVSSEALISKLGENKLSQRLVSDIVRISLKGMNPRIIEELIFVLDMRFPNLNTFYPNKSLRGYVIDNLNFTISLNNISCLLELFGANETDFAYATLQHKLPPNLKDYIQTNLGQYIELVLTDPRAANTQNEKDLVALINSSTSASNLIKRLLENNSKYVIEFNQIPPEHVSVVVVSGLCEFDWNQLNELYKKDNDNFLTLFGSWLNSRSDFSRLSKESLNNSSAIEKSERTDLAKILYRNLAQTVTVEKFVDLICFTGFRFCFLPEDWTEELADELVHKKRLGFSEQDVSNLGYSDATLAEYLIQHFDSFQDFSNSNSNSVELELEVISILLASLLSNEKKLYLFQSKFIVADEHKVIGMDRDAIMKLLLTADDHLDEYDSGMVLELIMFSDTSDDVIMLLTKWINVLDNVSVKQALAFLQHPYDGLGAENRRPRIPLNKINESLLNKLEEKGIIKQFRRNELKQRFNVIN